MSCRLMILIFFINLFVNQVNSEIVAHDLKCRVYKEEFLRDVKVFFHADSDINEFFANFTIIKPIPDDAVGHIRALKRSESGIYDIPTNFQFSRPFCETVTDPTSLFWYTIHTMIFDTCPPQPGTYVIERFVLIDDDHENFFRTALTPEKYMITFYVTHTKGAIFYCNVHYDLN
ncbi:uncharacterized protein [Chelonus insularis]|uniref:uncharacterized protein n=1 Tax=Chelonus insularis TaxID=460826 RepID=UPI00158C9C3C|nr:uncharacterized protein LOC118067798 [Chelonus insularis]